MLAALFCVECGKSPAPDPSKFISVAVRGTSFEAVDPTGKSWQSPQLLGSVLSARLGGSAAKIRIDAVWPDKGAPGVLLHRFSVLSPDGQWQTLCKPAPDGQTVGFPLRGRWSANGQLENSGPDQFEIVCAAGAQGKCVRLGYRPWDRLPNGSTMLPLFNACVRMLRADYSGQGTPTTKDGTEIQFFDRFGIHRMAIAKPFEFEAGWDERGAVCVHHPRIPANASLKQIEGSSARLEGRTGDSCSAERAEQLGALIFNGSRA